MTSVHIQKLDRRYHLPVGENRMRTGIRTRLNKLTERLLVENLDRELAALGFSPTDVVCFATLKLSLQMKSGVSDRRCLNRWQVTMSETLRHIVSRNDRSLWVRYRSTYHAMLSIPFDVLNGDTTACWAWQRLNLIHGNESPSGGEIIQQWFQTLLRDEHLPVLTRQLLRTGVVGRLVKRNWLSTEALNDLSLAVLSHYSSSPPLSDEEAPCVDRSVLPSSAIVKSVVRRLEKAKAFNLLRRQLPDSALHQYPALVILCCLDAEPVLLSIAELNHPATTREFSQALAEVLPVRPPGSNTANRDHFQLKGSGTKSDVDTVEISDRPVNPGSSSASMSELFGQYNPTVIKVPDTSVRDNIAVDTPVISKSCKKVDPHSTAMSDLLNAGSNAINSDLVSSYGGLLFLLNVITEADIDALVKNRPTRLRPVSWWMGLVIASLVKIEPTDPIHAVFLEDHNDTSPFPAEQPECRSSERIAVTQLTGALRQRLRERLNIRTEQSLTESVFRRQVSLSLEPGWVQAEFRLSDLCAEIRSAGLDLDPNHVRWLGCVVRFHYV